MDLACNIKYPFLCHECTDIDRSSTVLVEFHHKCMHKQWKPGPISPLSFGSGSEAKYKATVYCSRNNYITGFAVFHCSHMVTNSCAMVITNNNLANSLLGSLISAQDH